MSLRMNAGSATLQASLLMLLGAILTAVDAAIVKVVAVELHPLQIYFFRCLVALAVMAPFIMSGRIKLPTAHLPLHVVRAVLKLIGIVTLMFAITMLPLTTVTAIGFAAPLFVAIGAMLWFGESVRVRRLICLALGFGGVLIVVRPTSGLGDVGGLVALAAAMVTAAATLLMKFSSSREPATAIVALNLIISVPIALITAIPVWQWPSASLLGLLVLQGVLAVICQLCYVGAHSLAEATTLMPLDFLRLPAAIGIAYLVFQERPDLWTIAGAAVIFAAGAAALGRPKVRSDPAL